MEIHFPRNTFENILSNQIIFNRKPEIYAKFVKQKKKQFSLFVWLNRNGIYPWKLRLCGSEQFNSHLTQHRCPNQTKNSSIHTVFTQIVLHDLIVVLIHAPTNYFQQHIISKQNHSIGKTTCNAIQNPGNTEIPYEMCVNTFISLPKNSATGLHMDFHAHFGGRKNEFINDDIVANRRKDQANLIKLLMVNFVIIKMSLTIISMQWGPVVLANVTLFVASYVNKCV